MNSKSELVGKLRDEKSMVQYSMDVIFSENFIDCWEKKPFVEERPVWCSLGRFYDATVFDLLCI